MQTTLIKFLRPYGYSYKAGTIAAFLPALAETLVRNGTAELAPPDPVSPRTPRTTDKIAKKLIKAM